MGRVRRALNSFFLSGDCWRFPKYQPMPEPKYKPNAIKDLFWAYDTNVATRDCFKRSVSSLPQMSRGRRRAQKVVLSLPPFRGEGVHVPREGEGGGLPGWSASRHLGGLGPPSTLLSWRQDSKEIAHLAEWRYICPHFYQSFFFIHEGGILVHETCEYL
ncbi:hypothetical protein JTE90_018729 [Oedothorax gibbosus]|uniref:Uncharacterized protein n=1 Tax=Oedothorax gibbosus TaxID=931172 RepID=A0AAV6UKJ2_9ARAC|nr:hypothetical protein JTE90_018729 [Oedothorax gibbosus]